MTPPAPGATPRSPRRGLHTPLVPRAAVLAIAVLVIAGWASAEAIASTPTQASPTELTVIGKNTAFDVTTLTVPRRQPVTITFDNQDEDVTHNLHVLGRSVNAKTKIKRGPITQTLSLQIKKPGKYRYRCDVHPTQMKGKLIVQR